MSSVTFRGFVTSAAIIERSEWKIRSPIDWEQLDEDKAKEFIQTTPVRDKRLNMERHRFRILIGRLVQSATRNDLYKQRGILGAAKDSHWIEEEFISFIEKGNTGSTVVETERSFGLIVQTPKDNTPFFSFAITELSIGQRKSDMDWVCLLFADQDIDLENLMCSIPFPSDFSSPLSPDFLFLPGCLLQWQVEQTRTQLNRFEEQILNQEEKLTAKSSESLERMRSTLFQFEKGHLVLHRRWLFEQDLAVNLIRCFQTIEKRGSRDQPASYSEKLRQHVQIQNNLSRTLQYDLNAFPGKIKSQHKMIDSQISIMIAKNSAFTAAAARRDSSFMKTIAVITLLFLPGTFVAAIFSMSMFDWESTGAVVVSKHVWVYFAITIPLTLVVMVVWVIWTICGEYQYKKRMSIKVL